MRFSVKLIHIALAVIAAGAIVTSLTGEKGQLHLRKNGENEANIEIPFNIQLERFIVKYYENSKTPSDFSSSVIITDKSHEKQMDISMNHIGRYKGWRIYLADYDPDRRGAFFTLVHDPLGTGIVYTGFALLISALVCYASEKKSIWKVSCSHFGRKPKLYASAAVIAFLILLTAAFLNKYHQPLPILRTWLLPVHIVSIMTAYLLFLCCALIAGISFFMKDSADLLRHMSMSMLFPACFLLASGIIIGSLWANISWGGYWSWDPKETWALITLLVYIASFHPRLFKFLSNART